ncbi:MAG: HAD-IA family hydrolase, partial [Meiothermus sp.]|nr:HAD-IA family hydrolase [Meiothermus sp.]
MRRLKAVFFDLDDTVLKPRAFNPWAEFKKSHGLEPDLLILDGIARRPPDEQAILHHRLLQYEQALSASSEVREGMVDLLGELGTIGLLTALLTNNHRAATVAALQKHGLAFALVLTREEAPPKPSPALLQRALEHFDLSPHQALYIGDSEGDLQAAQAIDLPVWFLATPHNSTLHPRFEYPMELLQAL